MKVLHIWDIGGGSSISLKVFNYENKILDKLPEQDTMEAHAKQMDLIYKTICAE